MAKFLHVRFRVRDLEKSVDFYTRVLGMEKIDEKVSPAGNKLVFLQLPGNETLLELCWSPDFTDFQLPEDLVHLAFSTEDLQAFREKWEPEGIVFWPEEGPVNDRFYFIDDPDGYEIEIIKES
ncbi:MAG: VOC family protein [Limnochordia bacterium]|jgi:lactoylglutathione lyase